MLTEHIVDVREGQQSSGFRKYYFSTEMNDRAFSILVEEERQSKLINFRHTVVYVIKQFSNIYP